MSSASNGWDFPEDKGRGGSNPSGPKPEAEEKKGEIVEEPRKRAFLALVTGYGSPSPPRSNAPEKTVAQNGPPGNGRSGPSDLRGAPLFIPRTEVDAKQLASRLEAANLQLLELKVLPDELLGTISKDLKAANERFESGQYDKSDFHLKTVEQALGNVLAEAPRGGARSNNNAPGKSESPQARPSKAPSQGEDRFRQFDKRPQEVYDELTKDLDRKGTKGLGNYKDVAEKLKKAMEAPSDPKKWAALEAEAHGYLEKREKDKAEGDEISKKKLERSRLMLDLARQRRYQAERDELLKGKDPSWAALNEADSKLECAKYGVDLTPKGKVDARAVKAPEKGGEGAGTSEIFFLKGRDGKPKSVLKPIDGESGEPEMYPTGGGAVREVLTSTLGNVFRSVGLDLEIPKASFATLESDAFATGGGEKDAKAKPAKRQGAMIEFLESEGEFRGVLDRAEKTSGDAAVKELKKIRAADVQKIALLDFISLQTDRNAGNFLFRRETGSGGEEEYAMTPIDAGRSMHKTEYLAKQKALTGAYSSTGYADHKGAYTHGELLITQLPQAREPLGPECLTAIGMLDPDKMKAEMEKGYDGLLKANPQLKGTVDPSCFENMRRSTLFLKVAAKQKGISVAVLGRAYANGFGDLLTMEPFDLATFQARAKELLGLAERYEDFGGAGKLAELGHNPKDKAFDDLKQSIAALEASEETDQLKAAKTLYEEAFARFGAALPELLPTNPPAGFKLNLHRKVAGYNGIDIFQEIVGLGSVKKMTDYGGVYRADNALADVRNHLKAIQKFEAAYGTGAEAKVKRLANYPTTLDVKTLGWSDDLAQQVRYLDEYDDLGGDARFNEIKAMAQLDDKAKIGERAQALKLAKEYQDLGGDGQFKNLKSKLKPKEPASLADRVEALKQAKKL